MPIAKTARDLGQTIRARRKELSLDQAQLARQVGVSRQWLIDIEKGKPGAELGLVLRTLNALDLSMHLNPTTTPDSRSGDVVPAPEERPSAQVDIGQIVERNTESSDGRYGDEVSRALQAQDSILSLAKQLSADIPNDLQELVREYAHGTHRPAS